MDECIIRAISTGLFLHIGANLNATREARSAWTDSLISRSLTGRSSSFKVVDRTSITSDLNCRNMIIKVYSLGM